MSIADNIMQIRAKIAEYAIASGRAVDAVRLLAVSKTFPAADIAEARETASQFMFGENRVQEAELKFSTPRTALDGSRVRCHVIGPVQSNKLKKAAIVADCIHSIASMEAVEKLEKVCAVLPGENGSGKTLDILFQVNAGEEETKSGLDVHEAEAFLNGLAARGETAFPHLRFRGLMTIGKNTGVAEDSRECFAFLRNLQQKFLAKGGLFANFDQLSMGMTGDLEVAIEEGSTMIRVGTALFGERDYSKPVNDPV